MNLSVVLVELLGKVVIPELLEYAKRKFEETGQWPTPVEVLERISNRADVVIEDADALLALIKQLKEEQNVTG